MYISRPRGNEVNEMMMTQLLFLQIRA